MRTFYENALAYNGITIKASQATQSSIAGITADTILYSAGTSYGDYVSVARYFTSGGVGYAVEYSYPKGSQEQYYNNLGENIVSSFRFG
jgi:hypothetical protein